MPSDNRKVATVLRQLASIIEQMNDDDIDDFIASLKSFGTGSIRRPIARKSRPESVTIKIEPGDIDAILRDLERAPTRDAGTMFLDNLRLSRRDLVAVARSRSIHITKEDNIKQIEDKIVESVIGSRLNSLAIRGDAG